jgi:hypothetical protein
MKFYLGAHQPSWLAYTSVPLFVSHHRLKTRTRFPRALGDWACDSGGFSVLSKHGQYLDSAHEYAAKVRRYASEIGNMQWASIQDHMCEPFILRKTGRTMTQHLESTVQSYLDLKAIAPDLPWVPVLQGFELSDYLRCFELYTKAGVDLRQESLVGVGSICRRQGTTEAVQILSTLAGLGLRLHGFGFKVLGLRRVAHLLASSDSMAWSFHARKNPVLPGHTHKSCANCLEFAHRWRVTLLHDLSQRQEIESRQLSLFGLAA